MDKHITGLTRLTSVDEGDGLRPTFLHFFRQVHSTLDMAYSAIYDPLQFHFLRGNPTAKILPLL